MSNKEVYSIDSSEKDKFISILVDNLLILRTKAGLTQDQLANLIGVSRQTYSSIECKQKNMSWSLYMALIFVFDNKKETHDFIRIVNAFLEELIDTINGK